jgi:hypothetical protein
MSRSKETRIHLCLLLLVICLLLHDVECGDKKKKKKKDKEIYVLIEKNNHCGKCKEWQLDKMKIPDDKHEKDEWDWSWDDRRRRRRRDISQILATGVLYHGQNFHQINM